MLDLVEKTWDELGFKIKAPRYLVWVRTLPPPCKIGSIYIPVKQASFYGELPHLVTVRAVVLSSGPKGVAQSLNPGDIVAFKRVQFARYCRVSSSGSDINGPFEEYVGWVDANEIIGTLEE